MPLFTPSVHGPRSCCLAGNALCFKVLQSPYKSRYVHSRAFHQTGRTCQLQQTLRSWCKKSTFLLTQACFVAEWDGSVPGMHRSIVGTRWHSACVLDVRHINQHGNRVQGVSQLLQKYRNGCMNAWKRWTTMMNMAARGIFWPALSFSSLLTVLCYLF